MKRFPVTVILFGLPFCLAQSIDDKQEGLLSEAAKHIADLNRSIDRIWVSTPVEDRLKEECRVDCSKADEQLESIYRAKSSATDAVISRMNGEVDSYVAHGIDPQHLDHGAVERRLIRILDPAGERPYAFVVNVGRDRVLIVAYTLGPMGSQLTTLRAYKTDPAGLQLAGSAADMRGTVGLSVLQLPSPMPEQIWLLAKGQVSGANGPNTVMEVYAYDGTEFRTVWTDRAWGTFSIRSTERGFTVEGPYYLEDRERHDEYFLAFDGVHRFQ